MTQGVPGEGVVLHADVEGVDLAVGVEHCTVCAEKVKVKVAVDERWIQWAQHGQALESLGIAKFGLEGHPRPVSKEAVKGGRHGRHESIRGRAVNYDHLVQASGQTSLVCVCVSFERERQGAHGEEGDMDCPTF